MLFNFKIIINVFIVCPPKLITPSRWGYKSLKYNLSHTRGIGYELCGSLNHRCSNKYIKTVGPGSSECKE